MIHENEMVIFILIFTVFAFIAGCSLYNKTEEKTIESYLYAIVENDKKKAESSNRKLSAFFILFTIM